MLTPQICRLETGCSRVANKASDFANLGNRATFSATRYSCGPGKVPFRATPNLPIAKNGRAHRCPLKCWREANNLSQAEAVRALASADVPAKLATLRQWEIGRALARCDHDRRPPEISG